MRLNSFYKTVRGKGTQQAVRVDGLKASVDVIKQDAFDSIVAGTPLTFAEIYSLLRPDVVSLRGSLSKNDIREFFVETITNELAIRIFDWTRAQLNRQGKETTQLYPRTVRLGEAGEELPYETPDRAITTYDITAVTVEQACAERDTAVAQAQARLINVTEKHTAITDMVWTKRAAAYRKSRAKYRNSRAQARATATNRAHKRTNTSTRTQSKSR